MTPNTSSTTDPIAEAIQLLTEEADGLRECHTLAPGDWTGEPEAKAHYDRIMAVVNTAGKSAPEWLIYESQIRFLLDL